MNTGGSRDFGGMKKYLPVYTFLHFLVDLACVFYMTAIVAAGAAGVQDYIGKAIVYNFLAFALPMFLGILADVFRKDEYTAALGTLLVAAAFITGSRSWAGIALVGVGNGLFHIGAGRQILVLDRKHFAPSGIFIASGAIGVFIGKTLGRSFAQSIYYIIFAVLAAGAVAAVALGVLRSGKTFGEAKVCAVDSKRNFSAAPLLAVILIFFVVIIRSYYGFLTKYTWKSGFAMGLIFTACVAAGKLGGGIIADRLGLKLTTILSLAGAGILEIFAPESAVCGCISILLFNMTMPLTLKLLSDILQDAPGFAFGTLMMALFLGTLPNMAWGISWLGSPVGMLALCAISIIMLVGACIIFEKAGIDGKHEKQRENGGQY